jgi:hypothetical protein
MLRNASPAHASKLEYSSTTCPQIHLRCGRGRGPACGIVPYARFLGNCPGGRNDSIYLCSSSFSNSYAYPIYSYYFELTMPSNFLFFHLGITPISQKTPNEVLVDTLSER